MISDARRGHVSPGIYTEEKDVTYSVKSLGITSLGLAGETLYGPAFENIEIENWGEFVDYFGGTSTAKFKNGLPKYELPYVAKSYLEESRRLNVVRVLGLSGYHAGKAWTIFTDTDKPAIVLRSRMKYVIDEQNMCETVESYSEEVTQVTVGPYTPQAYDAQCAELSTEGTPIDSDSIRFRINVTTDNGEYKYNVSMNPVDNDYIYKVLSTSPEGTTPIYIDSIFEYSFVGATGVSSQVNELSGEMVKAYTKYTFTESTPSTTDGVYNYNYTTAVTFDVPESPYTYVTSAPSSTGNTEEPANKTVFVSGETQSGNAYDDYLEPYRCAITPWIVSEVAADENEATMVKLFRFYTISDGDASNYQVKVSIQNIKPETGRFDVVVRDFNDTDVSPMVLERFSNCSLIEGDASYVAYKIGTYDGAFEIKSKYIAVEMADGEDLSNHIPAGFLGYPLPFYGKSENSDDDKKVNVLYNTLLNKEIKPKRQYFGFSDYVTANGKAFGIERDIFSYKGRQFYAENKRSNGFHLDAILNRYGKENIYVDGANGYRFTTVSQTKVGSETKEPRFINANILKKTIYDDIAVRKFTVCFYGGFDGWDVNRIANGKGRSNTDEFKSSQYHVAESGDTLFKRISSNEELHLDLPSTAITTDYYAYLAGYRVFSNPQDVDINVFATPGIDWERNTLLTEEALDVIEDADYGRGGDALYIMNAPKDMDVMEVASTFEDKDIDTSYAATYFPWVMYFDSANKKYIELPITKDVVRNMAKTDNESFPWFAPAGTQRGEVKCIKALHKTTLAEEDTLYEARINPVKTFAQDGVKIWGNKTAYRRESPLNRVNVRRLMIRVKKLISDAAKHLIFEQYDDTLEKQFRGLVEPILADVKANRGIFDYRVITEVTPETRDQHILPAKILIKPTPALEYISISFVVYPESVSFEEN
jgi:hypothetical protein